MKEIIYLTESQKKRVKQLKKYVEEMRSVERDEFDKWFGGKKEFCTNVLSYLILIETNDNFVG